VGDSEQSERDVRSGIEDMEAGVDELAERSREVKDQIADVRSDWKAKRADDSVPGAEPAGEDDAEAVEGDPADSAEEGGAAASASGE
jgi:hypothetical protein